MFCIWQQFDLSKGQPAQTHMDKNVGGQIGVHHELSTREMVLEQQLAGW
jgi:hypothetical protein